NRCERDEDFIFYGNSSALGGAVQHIQLNGTPKEAITICLPKLPDRTAKIAFTVTIHEGEKHGFRMKNISNMYLRLVNADNDEQLFRYEYGSDLSEETAIVAGELYRHNGEWKFNAIGSGFFGGLEALCTSFGLELEEEASQEIAPVVEKPMLSS